MEPKKIIRYRIPISIVFPATHKRKGEPTLFQYRIQDARTETPGEWWKLHTIRGNYQRWAKKFEKIFRGEAVLELYYWSGKPYNSKCVTICQLGKDDGIGIQKVDLSKIKYSDHSFRMAIIDCEATEHTSGKKGIHYTHIAKNDGLSVEDFKEWFKNYNISEPLAIIWFCDKRY